MVEQPFLNSTMATCHILKRTQVNPLCLSSNNPIACMRANRLLSRRRCMWPQPIRGANPGPHAPRPVVSPHGHKGRPPTRPIFTQFSVYIASCRGLFCSNEAGPLFRTLHTRQSAASGRAAL